MGLFFKADRKHAVPRPHHKALRAPVLDSAPAASSRWNRGSCCRPRSRRSKSAGRFSRITAAMTCPALLQATGRRWSPICSRSATPAAPTKPQLTSLTINLHDTSLFDTVAGGAGYGGAFPFTVISHTGFELVDANGNEVSSVTVPDGATTLTLYFKDFTAGEKLVFSVDVDEAVGGNETVDGSELVDQKLTISGQPYTAKGATLDGHVHRAAHGGRPGFDQLHPHRPLRGRQRRILHRHAIRFAAQRRVQQRCRKSLYADS